MADLFPGGRLAGPGSELRRSQWFPLLSQRRRLVRKGVLIPAAVTIVTAALLAGLADDPEAFITLLAMFIGLATIYTVYRIAGKPISFPVLLGVSCLTATVLSIEFSSVFRPVYMGLFGWANPGDGDSLPVRFVSYLISAGMPEELTKSIPIFLGALIWMKAKGRLRNTAGVGEPLDGIVFGVASAMGFAVVETLWYAQDAFVKATNVTDYATIASGLHGQQLQNAFHQLVQNAGQLAALETVLFRLIGEIAGHATFSGIFGYYIGLAVLKPKRAVPLVLTGYGFAVFLHSFCDAITDLAVIVCAVFGVLLYALLASAILKARQISPTRAMNFAKSGDSVVVSGNSSVAAPPRDEKAVAEPMLWIGPGKVPLREGQLIYLSQIPELESLSGDGIVARMSRNPQDPSKLGLTNLSRSAWTWERPDKPRRRIDPQRSVHLIPGSRIYFGETSSAVPYGEVR